MITVPCAMPVEAFIDNNAPAKRGRPSPMAAYRAGIMRLDSMGYGQKQVAQWLSYNGVAVGPDSVRGYIKREKAKA